MRNTSIVSVQTSTPTRAVRFSASGSALACLLACMLACVLPCSAARGADDPLAGFNEILQSSFIAPLRAANVTITSELRAKCIAYQLERHLGMMGAYEADREAGRRLLAAVKDFVLSVSSPETWAVVEAGLQGQYTSEVERLLGGTAYVPPLIESLDELVRRRISLEFAPASFNAHPERNKIAHTAESLLRTIRAQRFSDVTAQVVGELAVEWPQILADMETDPEMRRAMVAFAESLEWRLSFSGLAATDPPLARLVFALNEAGEAVNYEMYLIRDAGTWRVVRFDPE